MTKRVRLAGRHHRVAQRVYVEAGKVTAGARMRPSFVMVGASRSGTTTLFRALIEHPQVRRPTLHKGVRYFDLNSYRPTRWYYGHFPLRSPMTREDQVTFEASGYYLFHPEAIPRMAAELPEVRVVMMLRDPVERAFSGWKHESARGFEWETFARALDVEDGRLRGEEHRMAIDPRYESFSHRHHSHRSRGEYATQLRRVLDHYPRSHVHIIESERFFLEPAAEYAALLDFLELAPSPDTPFSQHNARPSAEMPSAIREELRAYYQPLDADLAGILGHEPAWVGTR